jgi:hypothetical protein
MVSAFLGSFWGYGAPLFYEQARDSTIRCSFCTLEADRDDQCSVCGQHVHAACAAEHRRVYHPSVPAPHR